MEAILVLDMVKHYESKEHVKKIVPTIQTVLKAARDSDPRLFTCVTCTDLLTSCISN